MLLRKNIVNQRVQNIAIKRARPITEALIPLLDNINGKILDYGSGLGHIGLLISEYTNTNVEYVDVRKYPFTHPDVNITIFNGKILPYSTREFDVSIAIFVLHHVPNPRKSLEEMARVSERNLIICEDLIKSRGEFFIEMIKDSIVNCFIPHMTLQYKIESDWEEIFSDLGLNVQKKIYFESRYIFKFKHVAWLLEI